VRTPRRPDPEVLEFDYRVPTALGTLGWTAALVVLLVWGDGLDPDQRWRIGVCAVGMVLGVFAFFYIPYLLGRRARLEAARTGERAAADVHAEGAAAGEHTAAEGVPAPSPAPERQADAGRSPQ